MEFLELIGGDFGYAQYDKYKVVINMQSAFINATKLCRDYGKEGKKVLANWFQSKHAVDLMSNIKQAMVEYNQVEPGDYNLYTLQSESPIGKSGNGIVTGIYVRSILVPHILSWADPAYFGVRCGEIVNEYVSKQKMQPRDINNSPLRITPITINNDSFDVTDKIAPATQYVETEDPIQWSMIDDDDENKKQPQQHSSDDKCFALFRVSLPSPADCHCKFVAMRVVKSKLSGHAKIVKRKYPDAALIHTSTHDDAQNFYKLLRYKCFHLNDNDGDTICFKGNNIIVKKGSESLMLNILNDLIAASPSTRYKL